MSVGTVAAGASRLWPKRLNCPQDAHDYLFWNEISRPATSILFVVLPICGLIRRLDAHHMRPTQALELQRLALDRIKVRSLAGFDGDRHAGGRRTKNSLIFSLLAGNLPRRRVRH